MIATSNENLPANPSDDVILDRLARGDHTALATLYDRYGRLAYALAYRALGDEVAAEDVVRDAFVLVWRDAAGYDPRRGPLRSWLFSVVRQCSGDAFRERTRVGLLKARARSALGRLHRSLVASDRASAEAS